MTAWRPSPAQEPPPVADAAPPERRSRRRLRLALAVVAIDCGVLVLASQRLEIGWLDEAGAGLGIIALAVGMTVRENS
jgi:hypothetical protein